MKFFFLTILLIPFLSFQSEVIGEEAKPKFRKWSGLVFSKPKSGELKLDVIRPHDEVLRPAVLCLHGGFWCKGSRENIYPLAQKLAEKGYVGVSSSYRLTGTAPFPAQIEDVRSAIRFLRKHATDYGIDPNRIGVTGSSAGGHLAVLAGSDSKQGEEERPNAAVGIGAQSDLSAPHIQNVLTGKNAENWSAFLGGLYHQVPESYESASPLRHLSKNSAPTAFVCGERDHLSTRAERYRAEAFRLGVPTALTIIPEAPHNVMSSSDHIESAATAIDEFFQIYLGNRKTGRIPLVIQHEEGDHSRIEGVDKEWLRPGGGYGGCEGAQWIPSTGGEGWELLFAAHHDHLLFRWSREAGLRLWEEGTAELSTLRPTTNGFYGVEQKSRRLVKKRWNERDVEVLASRFDGKRLNRPNDLRIHPGSGTVWFTDPNFLFRTRPLETQELEGQFVFRYDPSAKSGGALTAPIRNLTVPNGIAFNRSGTKLYLGDNKTKSIQVYTIDENAEVVGESQQFATFPEGLDGISLAPDDTLWVATPGGIDVRSETGKRLAFLPLPGKCTSIDFAAEGDHHSVAVTTRDAPHITRIRFPKTY